MQECGNVVWEPRMEVFSLFQREQIHSLVMNMVIRIICLCILGVYFCYVFCLMIVLIQNMQLCEQGSEIIYFLNSRQKVKQSCHLIRSLRCSKNAILLIQETNLKWIEGNCFMGNTYTEGRGHHFGRGEYLWLYVLQLSCSRM